MERRVRYAVRGEHCVVRGRAATEKLTENRVELAQASKLGRGRFIAVRRGKRLFLQRMRARQVRCDVRQRGLLCEQHKRAKDVDQCSCDGG